MTVLDTDIVVDAMRGEPASQALVDALLLGPQPVAVSAVTVMQLHEGIHRSKLSESEASRVQAALLGIVTYPFTHEVAERAGRVRAQMRAKGSQVSITDLMIGATALHHGEPVATRNRRDFARIPGLEIVTP